MSSAEISIMAITFILQKNLIKQTITTNKVELTEAHHARAAENSFRSPKGNL